MMSCLADLQAIDPARNIARAYTIQFGQDLFGEWVVRRHWGRIGTQGQCEELIAPSEQAGLKLVGTWLRQRSYARKRIGVSYQLAGERSAFKPLP
jgi:predicted DNA-binding WGR domain protein